MPYTVDLTTLVAVAAGLSAIGASAVLVNRIMVKLAIPHVIEALVGSVDFLDTLAKRLSKHPDIVEEMRSTAEHKVRNVETLWTNQLDSLRESIDRNRKEDRDWREFMSSQITSLAKSISKMSESIAENRGRQSIHDPDSEM